MYGLETCPKTGRKHHQGWVQFEKPLALSAVKKKLGLKTAHFEIMRGSCAESEEYCEKDGEVTRFGKFISMGERVDVEEIRVLLSDSSDSFSMKSVADANFPLFLRHKNAMFVYRSMVEQSLRRPYRIVQTVVLAGKTRCGKTRLASEYQPYMICGFNLQWWDGYQGERVLCIDDFVSKNTRVELMLRLLDGHQMRIPIKGSFTYAAWDKVIITTNQVKGLYTDGECSDEHLAAFNARITATYSFFNDEPMLTDILEWVKPVAVVPVPQVAPSSPVIAASHIPVQVIDTDEPDFSLSEDWVSVPTEIDFHAGDFDQPDVDVSQLRGDDDGSEESMWDVTV